MYHPLLVAFLFNLFFGNLPQVDTPQQSIDIYKNSIALAGVGPYEPQSIIEKTIGTGIVFIYKNHMLVLTCRHVIEPELGKLTPKALLNVRDNQSGKMQRAYLRLNDYNWSYHPDDTKEVTRDLALFWFGPKTDKVELPHFSDEYNAPELKPDDQLIVLGYATRDLTSSVILDATTELSIRVINARFIDPVGGHKPDNYSRTVIQQNYAVIETDDILDGMSGGLVLLKNGSELIPIGILSGGGKGKLGLRGGQLSNVNFISFTHIRYVYDIMQTLK